MKVAFTDRELQHLAETLKWFDMPEDNIAKCVMQIAQGYGACRYLDGVRNGADAVIEVSRREFVMQTDAERDKAFQNLATLPMD